MADDAIFLTNSSSPQKDAVVNARAWRKDRAQLAKVNRNIDAVFANAGRQQRPIRVVRAAEIRKGPLKVATYSCRLRFPIA